jgi:hypothetical protein
MTSEPQSLSLRDLAGRCRKLALTVRSEAVRQHLIAMARQIEREAGAVERDASGQTRETT